jgi:hypothetical protein
MRVRVSKFIYHFIFGRENSFMWIATHAPKYYERSFKGIKEFVQTKP